MQKLYISNWHISSRGVKVKFKFTLEQAMKAQKESGSVDLLFV
jgi:hypothetical protein